MRKLHCVVVLYGIIRKSENVESEIGPNICKRLVVLWVTYGTR